jgi:hypothetical protein
LMQGSAGVESVAQLLIPYFSSTAFV